MKLRDITLGPTASDPEPLVSGAYRAEVIKLRLERMPPAEHVETTSCARRLVDKCNIDRLGNTGMLELMHQVGLWLAIATRQLPE